MVIRHRSHPEIGKFTGSVYSFWGLSGFKILQELRQRNFRLVQYQVVNLQIY